MMEEQIQPCDQKVLREIIEGSPYIRENLEKSNAHLQIVLELINVEMVKRNLPMLNTFTIAVQYNLGQQPINKLM